MDKMAFKTKSMEMIEWLSFSGILRAEKCDIAVRRSVYHANGEEEREKIKTGQNVGDRNNDGESY